MKWGLFSRVTVSLGSVLCAAMLGLGYVYLQNAAAQLSENQLTQIQLSALSFLEPSRRALQQNDHNELASQLQNTISDADTSLHLAYAAVIDSQGQVIAVGIPKAVARQTADQAVVAPEVQSEVSSETYSVTQSVSQAVQPPMGRIEEMQIRVSNYKGRPVREVVYPIVGPAEHLANIHLGYFENTDQFAWMEGASDVALIWLLSMVAVILALGASIKPLAALTKMITTTSFNSPRRLIGEDLRMRKDEVGVLACAFDAMIANLQKSYSELEQRESHYRQLVETANVIPWELDLNSRRITYVGPQISRILGYSVDEWYQEKFWLNHVYSEDVQMAEDFYRRIAAGGKEKEIEYRIQHANGDQIWVRDWVHKSSKNPRSPVLQGFMFDVSERVNARLELQRYREHLENVVDERTAELLTVNQELQSFAHSLSQDLRVPLRVINGFSRAMMEDYAEIVDEEGRRNLERICHGTEEMGKMIDDILILSRVTRQDLYRRKINLSEIAERIAANLAMENAELNVNCVIEKDISAYGDPELLKIVLEHLFANAWKFSSKTQDPEVTFSCQSNNGLMTYSVKDNGAGFDMQYVEKLFLPFRRLHNSEEFEGSGIGLATVKRIILRHGGEIWGEGSIGEGATLYFTLSVSSAEMMMSDNKFTDVQNNEV